VLYVTQPGSEVRKKGERLQVVCQEQTLAVIPTAEVERIVLLGPAHVTLHAAREMLERGGAVLYCGVNGRLYGMLAPGHDSPEMLIAQVNCYQDADCRLATARAVVAAKLHHQRSLLQRHARNHPDVGLDDAVGQLADMADTLPRRSAVSAVMGVEGQGAAIYFGVFGRCLRREGVSFTDRNRRPPRDPVNALLSLGYMLALGEAMAALQACGLHTGIGFLHEVSDRRPALGLDLLELVRQPLVDRLALSLFNRGVFGPAHFKEQPAGGVRLRPDDLKRYLALFERAVTTPFRPPGGGEQVSYRSLLRAHASELKGAIQAGQPWQPAALDL